MRLKVVTDKLASDSAAKKELIPMTLNKCSKFSQEK